MQHELNLEDLEIWLRDDLRKRPLYGKIRTIAVTPSRRHACRWAARVDGDFTAEEQALCGDIIRSLQKRFDLSGHFDIQLYSPPDAAPPNGAAPFEAE